MFGIFGCHELLAYSSLPVTIRVTSFRSIIVNTLFQKRKVPVAVQAGGVAAFFVNPVKNDSSDLENRLLIYANH